MARWCATRPRACACSPPPSRLCVAARAYPSILARRRVPVYAWPPSSHGPHVCPSVFACAAFASRVGLRIRRWRVAPPERCAARSHPLSRPRRLISPPLSSSPPRVCRYADNQEAEKDDFEEKVPPLPLPPLRLLFASPCSVPFAAAASVAVPAAHALPNLISRPHSSRRSRTSARPSSPRSTRSRAAPRAAAATSAATT